MTINMIHKIRAVFIVFAVAVLWEIPAVAQFSGSIIGTVTDPSGSMVTDAAVTITNKNNQVQLSATSNASGSYSFLNLAPSNYRVLVTAAGFAQTSVDVVLGTGETLNVPIKLTVAAANQSVQVTSQAPLLDTVDTRNQLTIGPETMETLPLPGRSLISLITLAPGTVGLGAGSGSPGSGIDNFSTETQVDASANGQGLTGNMFLVDGLDVTSTARDGVTNLTPNPDSIQETSIQINTFNVEYGRSSSIQMAMTTKSGTDHYHGNLSDYYTTQQLWARTEFTPVSGYAPFHSNNMSATIGGPIIPHHQNFFFFAIEPLRSLNTTDSSVIIEDPMFTKWAQQNHPNTFGTNLLTTYMPTGASDLVPQQTAAQAFGATSCGKPATDNIPCSMPIFDSALFNASSFRNGLQYDVRLDQYFSKDRVYGSFYRTTLHTGSPTVRPAFTNTQPFGQYALQLNEAHTFSPTMLNEAVGSVSQVEGDAISSKTMFVPIVNVGGLGTNFGTNGPLYFVQKTYHWRDVLTKVAGRHNLKFGYEGYAGNFVQDWTKTYNHPTFTFTNILTLVQDKPFTETNLAYDPVSGEKSAYDWNVGQSTYGFFAEDTWRPTDRLTLTYGVRWDDFGNVHSNNATSVLAPFYLGMGQNPDEQVANGRLTVKPNAMNHSISNLFSPRAGLAWDPTGNGQWVIRTGAGIYRRWTSIGELENSLQGNPPGPIKPTFQAGQAIGPLLTLGNSNESPYGFTYPTLGPQTIDAKGGIQGLQFGVGSVDPNLKSPISYIYAATVEREFMKNLVASIGYSGSRSTNLLSGAGKSAVGYGVNINSYPGDLIQHNKLVPTRLNTSFGTITYTANDREASYNALILAVRGRFAHNGFFSASYTHSSSQDDLGVYPTWQHPHQWYGPSSWDIPNRLSLVWNYQLPTPNHGQGILGHFAGGWGLSGITILQSGSPFTVGNGQPFKPTVDANGKYSDIATTSGDYNADGDNNDYPDVVSYRTATNRQAYLNAGLFAKDTTGGQFAYGWSNFPLPAFGQEGNEKPFRFRNPGFAGTDFALLKNTAIHEAVNLQLRFEAYNIFNRPNLGAVNTAIPQATFGKSTSTLLPRWIQLGANLRF